MLGRVGQSVRGLASRVSTVVLSGPGVGESSGGASGVWGTGRVLFVSGQLGVSSESDVGCVRGETRAAVGNLASVLGSAGVGLAEVVKANLILAQVTDADAVTKTMKEMFPDGRLPALTIIQAARLPKDALIEIEATALLPYSNCDAY